MLKRTRVLYFISCLVVIMSGIQAWAEPAGKITGGDNFTIPDWFKTSFMEIADDVEEANESGKHVLLFFHLSGCPYCSKMISENFQQEPLKTQIQANFDSIDVNIKGDREIAMTAELTTTERALAKYLKVKYTPTILFLDGNNKTVLRLNGYRSPEALKQALDFVQQKAYLTGNFSDFKREHMKYGEYRFIDDPLLQKTRDFSQLKKPVAILFEDDDCNECEAFHKKMLSRPAIREQFKQYHFTRLDAKSSATVIDFNGERTTPKEWAKRLKLTYRPGIVLFDEGVEVARTESMLYPFHFEHVLRLGLNDNYLEHVNYLSLMRVRQQQLMAQGINVNIGKPEDW